MFIANIVSISIHTLRAEGDYKEAISFDALYISIHTLRAEGDLSLIHSFINGFKFQSTPSGRRVTANVFVPDETEEISIHTLRAEGDAGNTSKQNTHLISIHTLRAEGDNLTSQLLANVCLFQSTPSGRRVTRRRPSARSGTTYFNPHPPGGG